MLEFFIDEWKSFFNRTIEVVRKNIDKKIRILVN